MPQSLAGSLKELHYFQEQNANAYLRRKKVSPSVGKTVTTNKFKESVVSTYRQCFDEALRKKGGDVIGIVDRLEQHRSTQSRRRGKKTQAQWDTYCLAMAAFDANLGLNIPRGRSVVIQAISETLPVVKDYWNKRKTHNVINPNEIIILHYASVSLSWRNAAINRDEGKLVQAANSILNNAENEGVMISGYGYTDIANLLQNWTTAWNLFHYLVSYRWKYWN